MQMNSETEKPGAVGSGDLLGPARFVGWHAQLEWKLQDFWIGAFWKRQGNCIDLWVCLLPCVPLHVSWWWTREPI
jgi:hypothetical protein